MGWSLTLVLDYSSCRLNFCSFCGVGFIVLTTQMKPIYFLPKLWNTCLFYIVSVNPFDTIPFSLKTWIYHCNIGWLWKYFSAEVLLKGLLRVWAKTVHEHLCLFSSHDDEGWLGQLLSLQGSEVRLESKGHAGIFGCIKAHWWPAVTGRFSALLA